MGLKSPAIDKLCDLVISADTREDLVIRTRALDRVLQWTEFLIPQFRNDKELVAYWNRFAHPQKTAKYDPIQFETWWVDQAKDKALQRGEKK
jgi:microcin C transport system substrate-binding protein